MRRTAWRTKSCTNKTVALACRQVLVTAPHVARFSCMTSGCLPCGFKVCTHIGAPSLASRGLRGSHSHIAVQRVQLCKLCELWHASCALKSRFPNNEFHIRTLPSAIPHDLRTLSNSFLRQHETAWWNVRTVHPSCDSCCEGCLHALPPGTVLCNGLPRRSHALHPNDRAWQKLHTANCHESGGDACMAWVAPCSTQQDIF